MSLFSKKDTPAAAPQDGGAAKRTLFGGGAAQFRKKAGDAPQVVDKGKSFSLFVKQTKSVDAEDAAVREMPVHSSSEDAPHTDEAPHVIDVQAQAQPQPVSEPGQGAAPTAAPKKGLFGALKAAAAAKQKPAKEQKPKTKNKEKADKPKKAKDAPRFFGKTDVIQLHTEIGDGALLSWELSAQGLTLIKQLDDAKPVASFTRNDFRFAAPKKLGYTKANHLVMAETSEYCAIVNRSGSGGFGAVYAASLEDVKSADWASVPGVMALDLLLARKAKKSPGSLAPGKEAIVGFQLQGEGWEDSLVILYHLTAEGEITHLQVSVNPDEMGFVLSGFAQFARITAEDAPVILFSAQDLLSVASEYQAYPKEAVWNGIPVSKILNTALMGSISAAVVCVGLAGTTFLSNEALLSKTAQLQESKRQNEAEVNAIVSGSVVAFANKSSLNSTAIFDRAQALWIPGTVLSVRADYGETTERYEISMPLMQQGKPTLSNTSAPLTSLTPEQLPSLVDYKAPSGCERTGTNITGNLDEIKVIVNCPVATSVVSRYSR